MLILLEDYKVTELLTRYYGYCGEIMALKLKEIEFEKLFIHWDLDWDSLHSEIIGNIFENPELIKE